MDWGGGQGAECGASVSQVASDIPASAGVRQPVETGVMAVSCIFLCCRGDRVLFLPREREVEVSSFGSLLKRKDMARRGARSETERGRRGGLYPEAVAGARMQTGRENVDNRQFSRTRRVVSHPVMTASRQRQHAEADIAPPESGRGPLGGQEKDSRFAIQAFRSPLRGRCARGRAASHSKGAIA